MNEKLRKLIGELITDAKNKSEQKSEDRIILTTSSNSYELASKEYLELVRLYDAEYKTEYISRVVSNSAGEVFELPLILGLIDRDEVHFNSHEHRSYTRQTVSLEEVKNSPRNYFITENYVIDFNFLASIYPEDDSITCEFDDSLCTSFRYADENEEKQIIEEAKKRGVWKRKSYWFDPENLEENLEE